MPGEGRNEVYQVEWNVIIWVFCFINYNAVTKGNEAWINKQKNTNYEVKRNHRLNL